MLLVMMVIAATISSCSSDDSSQDPVGGGDNPGVLNAKVNGVEFRSLPQEAEGMVVSSDGQSYLSFAGRDGQGRELGISIDHFEGVGTYNLFDPNSGNVGIGMYIEGEGDNVQAWMIPVEGGQIGKLIVTDYTPNQRIKGTFYFEAYNPFNETTKNVTEGVFDLRVGTEGL